MNQEQNEQVIGDIVWETLLTTTSHDDSKADTDSVTWGVIKEMIRNFIRSQLPEARALDDDELLHIQCMIFLPLALRLASL